MERMIVLPFDESDAGLGAFVAREAAGGAVAESFDKLVVGDEARVLVFINFHNGLLFKYPKGDFINESCLT